MSIKRSMTDVAFQLLETKNDQMSFDVLWKEICSELGFSQEQARTKIAIFYTQLIIDGRFVTLGENVWDLRKRCTFDKVHIDMNDVYVDDEDEAVVYDDEAEEGAVFEDEEESEAEGRKDQEEY